MTATAPEIALDLRDLTKTFTSPGREPVHAVRGVDLAIPQGQVVAFLGPNGAGKTTTLDMVLGLTEPTSGTASVLGLAPRAAIDSGRISAVLQSGGLLRDISVRETVEVIASMYRFPREVGDVLAQARVEDIADRKVSKCSGGEQQRLRFALALLPDPDLLVLDEPTAGMDVRARREFWDTMRADADAGRTVIFATHYLEEADAFAERIVMIANGRIVADDSTQEIRARASGRTVSAELPEGRVEEGVAALRTLPSVHDVQLGAGRVTVTASDSDAVALALLRDLGGRRLEITSGSLESAFMTITGDPPTSEHGGDREGAAR